MVKALLLWARWGKASGYLYIIIEKFGRLLETTEKRKTIFGDVTFNCSLRDSIQQKVYFFGSYEAVETHVTSQVLKPGMVVIDAGANVGYYTLLACKKVGEQGQVHAFEPIPENYVQLARHITENEFADRCSINNLALWNRKENLRFQIAASTAENCGTYTAAKPTGEVVRTLKCTATTIDDYVQEKVLPRVDFLKMDIEGAELMALEGAQKTLRQFSPTILLEVSPETYERFSYSSSDIFHLLSNLDYQAYLPKRTQNLSRQIHNLTDIVQDNVMFSKDPALTWQGFESWDLKDLKKHYLAQSS